MTILRLEAIRENISAAWRFVVSFRKSTWALEDYPISIRAQRIDVNCGYTAARFKQHAYLARVVKWWTLTGGGETPQDAMRELAAQFESVKAERQREGRPLPRPGTAVPIQFAARERVGAHPELADDFVRRVLGLDWAWISDDSSLWDFHTDETSDALFEKIKDVYGVDVSDIESGNLAQILDRIAAAMRLA